MPVVFVWRFTDLTFGLLHTALCQKQIVVPAKAGTHNPGRLLLRRAAAPAFAKLTTVVIDPGSRSAWPGQWYLPRAANSNQAAIKRRVSTPA